MGFRTPVLVSKSNSSTLYIYVSHDKGYIQCEKASNDLTFIHKRMTRL